MKGVINILTARLKNGTRVILDDAVNREYLRTWRTQQQFSCPQCGERVLLKVGWLRIPHFAHEVDAACITRFSEGESMAHLQGKQELYTLFQRLNKDVELEPFIPELAQRPDLLIRHNGHSVPIEFQCSRISKELKNERTAGYHSKEMNSLWILQTPTKFRDRPEGLEIFSFSKFHQLFFTTSNSPEATLLTLSPQTKQFHYFSHLLPIDGNRFIGIHRKLPIDLQTFPLAKPKLPTSQVLQDYVTCYVIQRRTFLQRAIFLNRRGIQDPFLRYCYELKLHPTELPEWIGVPVKGNGAFLVQDCVWQLGLLHLLYRFDLTPSSVPIRRIHQFVTSFDENREEKVAACLAYYEFLNEIEWKKNSFQFDELVEKKIFQLLSVRFLAMQIEN